MNRFILTRIKRSFKDLVFSYHRDFLVATLTALLHRLNRFRVVSFAKNTRGSDIVEMPRVVTEWK